VGDHSGIVVLALAELTGTLDAVTEDFHAAEHNFASLFVRVARSSAFRAAQSFSWQPPP
jgi:hypothetical protein